MNTDQIQFAFAFLRTEPLAAARLLELQPAQGVAAFLETAPHQDAWQVLRFMLPTNAAAVMEKMVERKNVSIAVALMTELSHSNAAAILRAMESGARQRTLDKLPLRFKTACSLLLHYSATEIGAWIKTDITMVAAENTVTECLLNLKKKDRHGTSCHIYAVSRNCNLIGTLSFISLLQAQPQRALLSILDKNPTSGRTGCLRSRTGLSSAIQSPLWHLRDCVPVINRQGELIGELHHHALRGALAIEQQLTTPAASNSLAAELSQAYGDSVAQMFSFFLSSAEGGSSKQQQGKAP